MGQNVILKVVGDNKMSCGGCEHSVTATLSQLPGVEQVRADRNTQRIDVTLDSGDTDVAALQTELQELGYKTDLA